MQKVIKKILTSKTARTEQAVKANAIAAEETFAPWGSSEEL